MTPTTADLATSHALFNCLTRELGPPEASREGCLLLRLRRTGAALRSHLRVPAAGPSHRLVGPVERLRAAVWEPLGWRGLAELAARELELATGTANGEFLEQIATSHDAMESLLRARAGRRPPADAYLESEQALVAGHRFHPSPKARPAGSRWLDYAPEAHASFPLHHLAVREDLVVEDQAGDGGALALLDRSGPPAPPGYRPLPAHPWQLALLAEHAPLRAALRDRRILDLGPGGRPMVPTSSVRTVYDPAADVFYKFSLDVRITNCVRKSAWYELAGSVTLSRLLDPVFGGIERSFPGTVLLTEPAYRTVGVEDRRLHEGLAVIVRQGVRRRARPGATVLLAAAIADEQEASSAAAAALLARGGRSPAHALDWWEAYLSRVVPPVLHAYLEHGVVLEPHLQNVLVGVDAEGMPVQAVFRDLEGTKLVPERHQAVLAGLAAPVRDALVYDSERGWRRVVYCLVVNHLAEVAAAVAQLHHGLGPRLWRAAREHLAGYWERHGRPRRVRALLEDGSLPAKANLLVRWAAAPDRQATYVAVPNPLRGALVVAARP